MKINLGNVETSKYGPINSIQFLNREISRFINETYSPYGFVYGVNDIDINITDRINNSIIIINSSYISKMVNNYTIFRRIIQLNNISNESDFYDYMLNNLDEIYHWDGKYFDTVTLPILINSSRKGNIGEKKSKEFLKSLLAEKGLDINIESPTIDEDISGIDAKFTWRGKIITAQIKPYETATINKDYIVSAYSQGSLSLNTDYLILYKGDNIIVIKGKEVTIKGNYFIFNKDSVVGKSY
jgi:hypothetical protein